MVRPRHAKIWHNLYVYIYIYIPNIHINICMYGLDFSFLRFGVSYYLVNIVGVIKGCSATVFEGFAQQK